MADRLGIDEGSQAVVWRAHHRRTGEEAALKLLKAEASDPRFAREVEAVRWLQHPNIPLGCPAILVTDLGQRVGIHDCVRFGSPYVSPSIGVLDDVDLGEQRHDFIDHRGQHLDG